MTTLGSARRLQRLYRLHILAIPRQRGSLIVPGKAKTLMRGVRFRPLLESTRFLTPIISRRGKETEPVKQTPVYLLWNITRVLVHSILAEYIWYFVNDVMTISCCQ